MYEAKRRISSAPDSNHARNTEEPAFWATKELPALGAHPIKTYPRLDTQYSLLSTQY